MIEQSTMERPEIDVAALVEVSPKDALAVFSTKREDGKPHPIDHILARVRQEIDGFEGDVSTTAGRKKIASQAYRVSQAKSALKKVGDDLAAAQKEIPKRIDATRKHITDTLDAWRDEVRKPLDDWETAEKRRIATHTEAVDRIKAFSVVVSSQGQPLTVADLNQNLAAVTAIEIGPACEEFEDEYRLQRELAISTLNTAIAARTKYEAEQAELIKLRAEAAERERKDNEERLRKEGEDRARLEAENDARAAAQAADLARRKAQDEADAQILAAQRAAEAAELRAQEAETKAKADLEAKKRADDAEQKRREENIEHRRTINAAALGGLIDGGVPDDQARAIIRLIVAGQVPHVSINY